jgi:hypothetical protein
MSDPEVLTAVKAALDAGIAILPPKQDGTKAPDVDRWTGYQKTAPTIEEVRAWYSGNRTGVGVLTGRVSGIEMLEFEGRAVDGGILARFIAMAEATGLGELVARIEAGYTETTPSGGLHWIYRVAAPLPNTKLARRQATADELAANAEDRIKVLIETRGEGGYVVTAPSNGKVHPSGGRWALTSGGFASLATITLDERDALFDLCRTFDRMPVTPPRLSSPAGSDRPGDRYNERSDVHPLTLELLERHGWARVYSHDGTDYLRRPGKDRGISASLSNTTPGVLPGTLYVFSTSTVFDALRAYDPFGVLAVLEHGGDFKAAAAALEPPGAIRVSLGAQTVTAGPSDPSGRKQLLTFQSARELTASLPATTPWLVAFYVAIGALHELVGRAKAAGKTTFIAHLIRALLDGSPFLQQATMATPVVFLTEQPATSLRTVLERTGIADRDDLLILTWREARGVAWPDVVAAAVAECARIGARALIVDTLPAFAGIHGDAENDAGAALAAIEPLQAAAADGLAVIVVRHERKGGGDVGDSGRGSSAFTGAVDVVMRLARQENPVRPTVRVLSTLSRFDETPPELVIELTDAGYIVLGDQAAVAFAEARATVLDLLPEDIGLTVAEILERAGGKRTTIQGALGSLIDAGEVGKVGSGRRGDPFRYRRFAPGFLSAERPPKGGTVPAYRSDREEDPGPPLAAGSVSDEMTAIFSADHDESAEPEEVEAAIVTAFPQAPSWML